jgi:hypothetical protein
MISNFLLLLILLFQLTYPAPGPGRNGYTLPALYIAGSGGSDNGAFSNCYATTGVSIPVGALVIWVGQNTTNFGGDGVNTYTQLAVPTAQTAYAYYTVNTSAQVLTVEGGKPFNTVSCAVAAYYPSTHSFTVDGTPAQNSNTSTASLPVGPVTTTNAADLLVIPVTTGTGGPFTPSSTGFSVDFNDEVGFAFLSQSVSSAAAYTPTVNVTCVNCSVFLGAWQR